MFGITAKKWRDDNPDKKGLFANYTMRQLLDELDVIECYEAPGTALIVGEVLKKQEQLYSDLGVTPLPAKA